MKSTSLSGKELCITCRGSGRVMLSERISKTCPNCQGTGYVSYPTQKDKPQEKLAMFVNGPDCDHKLVQCNKCKGMIPLEKVRQEAILETVEKIEKLEVFSDEYDQDVQTGIDIAWEHIQKLKSQLMKKHKEGVE